MAWALGVLTALIVGAAVFYLRRHGAGSLDNDAYSYVDEWMWVRKHGLFGPLRPLTGNMPKPLLVLLYGLLYQVGGRGVAINLLCVVTAGAAASLACAIGRELHSDAAGVLAAALLVVQEPFLSAATAGNSTLFLLVTVLAAFYVQLVVPPGSTRAYGTLGLLLVGGLCRPDGWLLYLLAWLLGCVVDARTRWWPASPAVLLPAAFAPFLTNLLDRAFFGDWAYSSRSFRYFYVHFPGVHAPLPEVSLSWATI